VPSRCASWIGAPVARQPPADGNVLFVGTLEPRKNLGALLDAWELVASTIPAAPRLRIAGGVRPGGEAWLQRLTRPPLKDLVDYVGYVGSDDRRRLYDGARLLVLPSFHEGFGLPVLEAMALGIPVVTSNRGALPEVAGDAGLMVDPDDRRGLADAICALLLDDVRARDCARRGLQRAATFTWDAAARALYDAYTRILGPR
jgi:glycosyltransferase involved in cell wall biosynthesis